MKKEFIELRKLFREYNIEDTFVDVLKKMPVSQVQQFEGIVTYIEEAFELNLPDEEKAYLTYVLMTLRKQNVLNIERILQETAGMMREIFQRVLDRYYIDLSPDKKLAEGLSLHIYSTVMRKDLQGEIYANYQIRDIKKQYTLGFEMAVIAAGVIEEEYQYKVNDNEMSYLALHFQAALERIKNQEEKLKAVVVCKYGMAAASLISTKIQRFFPQIEIVAIVSRHEFLSRGEEAYEADRTYHLQTKNNETNLFIHRRGTNLYPGLCDQNRDHSVYDGLSEGAGSSG